MQLTLAMHAVELNLEWYGKMQASSWESYSKAASIDTCMRVRERLLV